MNQEVQQTDVWAVIELMGHDVTAGIIKQSDLGSSLIKIDVPVDDGFRTEYIGDGAVFRIRIVSKEIARAYARPERGIVAYNEPIVPRAQYEEALRRARKQNEQLENKITILTSRLTHVNALPETSESCEESYEDEKMPI